MVAVDKRRECLQDWINSSTPYSKCKLELASADASFRRYFRLFTPHGTLIVMDAPPSLEPCEPFVKIGQWMEKAGIQVPRIYFKDIENGFLILSDFGDVHYEQALRSEQRNQLYELAINEILHFQTKLQEKARKLPKFDTDWQAREVDIFREWCLPDLNKEEFKMCVKPLLDGIEEIPKSFMHRDFHCRNLLLLENGSVGIIDFQGAMSGPLTYDLVSLLRDCYLNNSPDWITEQVMHFRTRLIQNEVIGPEIDPILFQKWFDWTGLQRHIKCVGIFHRLKIRDKKPQYLLDVPRVLDYIQLVLNAYPELSDLKYLVQQAQILSPDSSS